MMLSSLRLTHVKGPRLILNRASSTRRCKCVSGSQCNADQVGRYQAALRRLGDLVQRSRPQRGYDHCTHRCALQSCANAVPVWGHSVTSVNSPTPKDISSSPAALNSRRQRLSVFATTSSSTTEHGSLQPDATPGVATTWLTTPRSPAPDESSHAAAVCATNGSRHALATAQQGHAVECIASKDAPRRTATPHLLVSLLPKRESHHTAGCHSPCNTRPAVGVVPA